MNVRARLPLIAVASLSLALLAQAPAEERPKKPHVAKPNAKKSSSAPTLKDECQSDADCVPATPCHPSTCAPAPHKVADIPCTMECRGGTVDCGYNHCGCVKARSGTKVCGLVPGPKR